MVLALVMVLVRVMVLALVRVLVRVMELSCVMVIAPVMSPLRGSHVLVLVGRKVQSQEAQRAFR